MLEEFGHKVFAAVNGTRALEILRGEDPIDLLITDQAMPGMKGSELAATIRAERPDLPVIIATGYAELSAEEGPSFQACQTIFPAGSCESDFGSYAPGGKETNSKLGIQNYCGSTEFECTADAIDF